MDKHELLGLQRAEFQRAEKLDRRANFTQIMVAVISCIAVFLSDSHYVTMLAILGLLLSTLWIYLKHEAKSSHGTAESARRMVVLINGLNITPGGKSYTDLKLRFKAHDAEGAALQDPGYFKARSEFGEERLAEILEESSFWSMHLLKRCSVRYWVVFSVCLLITIVAMLLFVGVGTDEQGAKIAQVICILLLWLITGNLFTKSMAFTSAASSAENVESRLAGMSSPDSFSDDVYLALGDYNALLEVAPTIPTSVYDREKIRLNKLWSERQRLRKPGLHPSFIQ